MKYSIKAGIAALALMVAGTANAASISNDDIIVNIVRDGVSGDSMLINTGVASLSVADGSLTSWDSSAVAGLTSAINNFISGASSVTFWVIGRTTIGTDNYFLSDIALNPTPSDVGAFQTAFESYATIANVDAGFAGAANPWLANIPSTSPIHYTASDIAGNGLIGGIGLGTSAAMIGTRAGFFGSGIDTFLDWNLAADGTLSYGTVIPVPAAVWLFGSGLLGLVGVARRKA